MEPNETSGKEAGGANYVMTVTRNGYVNVKNRNYGDETAIFDVTF